MSLSSRYATAFLALLAAGLIQVGGAAGADRPQRVVSMNVCTDQLAMLVGAGDQLVSVSHLAGDPGISVLASQAGRYEPNQGQAEQVFLMRPDLVLAGTYTAQAAVDMLRRLGFRVEEFAPESTFDGIRSSLLRIGDLLGRQERARELVAELDQGLADLKADPAPPLRVAIYSANSYTSGDGSLSDAVIEAAGLVNVADELGIVGTARLPLEQLVMARPDLVIVGEQDYPRPALAQQNFTHPAFEAVAAGARLVRIPDRYWICGAPFTLEAVRLLRDAARETAPRVAEHADD
jgi:iron complex transport system substrate-binding protein